MQVRRNPVPRMTLNDRIHQDNPMELPKIGRPIELSKKMEKNVVDCLVLCGQYQYPMRRRDLQKFIQSYCTEHNIYYQVRMVQYWYQYPRWRYRYPVWYTDMVSVHRFR